MAIFSLLAKLGLDGTSFETGLKRSQSLAKGIGRDIAGTLAGIFAVDKLAQFGMEAVNTAGKLNDLSTELGVSAKFLQEMKFAAEMGGSSLEDVSAALQKITIARGKALGGDQGLLDAFGRFGITAQEIKSAKIEDIFLKIGKAFEGDANPQNLLAPFRELAGRGAGALIPAMAEGLGDAADQANRLGMVMSDDVIQSLDEANDRIELLQKTAVSGMGTLISQGLVPLMNFFDKLGAAISTFEQRWMNVRLTFLTGGVSKGMESLRFSLDQARQAYVTAGEEQDAELAARREAREKRAATRRKVMIEPEGPTKTIAVSAASGDQLAKTGGFTAFQTNLDRYFGSVKSQAQDLRDISRNTERTAKAVEE